MNSPGFSACARTGRRLLARSFDHRLRQPVPEPEVVVRVVERRRRVRGRGCDSLRTPSQRATQLVVLPDGIAALLGVVRANRMAIACRSSPARPPTQWSGWLRRCRPGCRRAPPCPARNSSGKVASDSSGTPSARRPFQVNANVTQRSVLSIEACAVGGGLAPCRAVPTATPGRRRGCRTTGTRSVPSSPACGSAGCAGCRRARASSRLRYHCIWSSMSENAALSRSAFLISSAVT